jgi:hypothetical protein
MAVLSGGTRMQDRAAQLWERARACLTDAASPRVDPLVAADSRVQLVGDALRDNVILNKWEFAKGITVLSALRPAQTPAARAEPAGGCCNRGSSTRS